MKYYVVTVFFLFTSTVWALSPTAKIIRQKTVPIEITKYSARYQEQNRYSNSGILHEVQYKNIGKQQIEAIEFGLVSFNVWNEFLDTTAGISMQPNDPGDTESTSWLSRAYGDFAFLSGFAYVKRIRYQDGTIWRANLDEITDELVKIQSDFDVKSLEPKKNNAGN